MKRRNFLRQSALGVTGLGVGSIIPLPALGKTFSPADKVNVALIGARNMGFGILKHALSSGEVNCVAICDVDQNVLSEKAKELALNFKSKPAAYSDFRRVLERKDVDAVIIGSPDHWHCLHTVYALQAGKDAYVEKPMANTIGECNLMLAAAKRYNKVIQVGQQQRSSTHFQKAIDILKNGSIGKLRKINVWANFNYGLGPAPVEDSPVPAGVDYDMWLGPAPSRPFNQNRFHSTWRHFWDYGGGLMSDWGVHLLDIPLWSKDITTGPREVLVYAANLSEQKRMRETFDTMSISYPHSDFVLNYDLNAGIQQGPFGKPYGIAFLGDSGTLVVNRNYLEVFPEWDDERKKPKGEAFKLDNGTESHDLHVKNFLDCIKSRRAPVCTPEIARAAALYAHIPNIAARVGAAHLKWNDEQNSFENNTAANDLITPEYRAPWVLPKI